MTDQDSKMSEYRRKLRAYGEDVTEDEDDEDEEGDFAISENFDDDLDDIQWHALFSGHDGLGLIAGAGEGYVITPNYLSFITWEKYTRKTVSLAHRLFLGCCRSSPTRGRATSLPQT